VICGGVAGVFILGSTGEGPSLTPRLRRDFVTLCCDAVREILANERKRRGDEEYGAHFRILVGVSDTNVDETIALAEHAAVCGADAVVIAPPFYFPIGQAELKYYVQHVVDRTTLPVFLYNMPALTKVTFEIETVRELARLYGESGRIVGIKDSSFDLDYIAQLCKVKSELCPSWSVMTGAEWHVAKVIRLGGDGGVVGGSNIIPEAFVSFYQGAATGNQAMEDEAYQKIQALKKIYDMAKGRFVQATKTSLCVLGMCQESYAMPLLPFVGGEKSMIEKVIGEIKAMDRHE
jgi:4-hydroxy-tetrahydrodipicolinate synthase